MCSEGVHRVSCGREVFVIIESVYRNILLTQRSYLVFFQLIAVQIVTRPCQLFYHNDVVHRTIKTVLFQPLYTTLESIPAMFQTFVIMKSINQLIQIACVSPFHKIRSSLTLPFRYFFFRAWITPAPHRSNCFKVFSGRK